MSLEEAILNKFRRLPPAKQEEVLRFADGLQRTATVRIVPSLDRTKEMKWIDENRAAYAEQWVEVENDGLMAAGMDPLKISLRRRPRVSKFPSSYMCFQRIRRLFRVGDAQSETSVLVHRSQRNETTEPSP